MSCSLWIKHVNFTHKNRFYNSLPLVAEAAEIASSLEPIRAELMNLIAKHGLANLLSVRLIHKHFALQPGEIACFRTERTRSATLRWVLETTYGCPGMCKTYGATSLTTRDVKFRAFGRVRTTVPQNVSSGPRRVVGSSSSYFVGG